MYSHHDGQMSYPEEGAAFYPPIGSNERVLGVNRNLLTRGFAAAGTGSIVDEFIDFWRTPEPTVLDEVVVEGDPNSQVAPPSATVPPSTTAPRQGTVLAPVPQPPSAEKPSILPYLIIGAAVLAGGYVIFGGKKW